MSIRNYTFTFLVLLLCPLFLAGSFSQPVHAAAQPAIAQGGITLDFKNIELSDLIQTISALTGKNFVYDDSIRGKATIISSEQMNKKEAYQLFLTVLNIKGYTVVPSGKTHKIVATKTARESNLPTLTTATNQDQFVTRMITLKHIDAGDIANTILSPLMPRTSNIAVYQPSNMLIITDNAANITRLTQIIKELDVPSTMQTMKVIALKYADAKNAAAICTEIIGKEKDARRRRMAKNVKTTSGDDNISKVIAYERTNRLIVMGTEGDLNIVLQLIDELDQPLTSDHSRFNLYYLENADAETLSKTLNQIITGIKTPARSATKSKQPFASIISTEVSITADKPTNSLIINATPEDYVVLKEIINQLDIRRKQVYVEALIMELSMDATQNLGIGLQGGFEIGDEGVVGISTNMDGAISPDLLTTSVKGILAGGFSKLIEYTDDNGDTIRIPAFSALLNLAKTDTNVNILSAPRLLTSANEEAEIIVGRNVPIITSRLSDTGSNTSSLAQSVSIERKDVALTLRFTPQITEGDLVCMKIYQETTDLVAATNNVGNVNDVGPTFTTRKISNTVLAKDGQTVVLGGLIATNITENETKVPLLGDIPLLGWLFKTTNYDEQKTNMLVFITPTIIKNADDLTSITNNNRHEIDILKLQATTQPDTERE